MQDKNKIPMVSSKIASLWTSYMNDNLAVHAQIFSKKG